jgi:hypothetical protein
MELNPEKDLVIDVTDLTVEFRHFPTVFFRYCQQKANAEAERDFAKCKLKEVRATVYKTIKGNAAMTGAKLTEAALEAEIDTNAQVIEAQGKLIQTEHNAATIGGAVESMRAKKDMLMQLGADRRKE